MVKITSLQVSKKIFHGAAISVASVLITSIVGLALMPLLVNHLGDRLYGVWILVGTLTGYFTFLDLGLSKAVMRFVSQALGKGNQEEANEWISIALICFTFLTGLSILSSFVVWSISPHFLTTPEDIRIIPTVLLIALFAFSATLPTRCFVGILEAHIRRDIVSLINVTISLIRSCTIFFIIIYEGSLLQLVIGNALLTILDGALLAVATRRIHGFFYFKIKSLQIDKIKVFFDYAFSSFTTQIMDIIRYSSYPLIITPFLGLAAVTPFAIAEKLIRMLVVICNGILLNLTPAFSQLEGQSGVRINEKLIKYYFFSYKLSCYLGVFSVGMTIILGSSFIETWMGSKHLNAVPILYVLSAGILFSLIQIPTLCLLFATSKHKFYAITNTIHAMLTILLCLLLVNKFKLIGIAFGISIINFLIKFIIQPYGAFHLLDTNFLNYHLHKSAPNIAIPLFFIIITNFSMKDHVLNNFLDFFIFGLVSTAIFIVYIFILGFNNSEKLFLLKLFKL